ncbi:MAG: phenylalanine--tRNA ligase subunit alpha [Acidobacteria bacterium]|nr:phenylalanine--tRNA ligase subunit alpha [Acidobacteriota bacterium]MBI3263954.1 phenylalanine--tRNA ligase subunit alpha [Acidobacteriota bacterium]
MPHSVDPLRSAFADELQRVSSERELRALRDRYLGRKGGVVATLMKQIAAAPSGDRRLLGQLANEFKTDVERALAERQQALQDRLEPVEAVDITLPGRPIAQGRRHPLVILRDRLEDIFAELGYAVVEGPEIEDEYHNFEALNIAPDHPARDMQDTLYLNAPIDSRRGTAPPSERTRPQVDRAATLLRTHTSGMQIRYMEAHEPPIRIIAPGRVYRRDNLDLTHTPMFHQVEGLVVDESITMADLKGTLTHLLRELFGPDARALFRPTFFPYTEPSADVFVSCHACHGSGCPVCKRTGWLEILGCGMVHPAVFEAVGYDPERFGGFAFGIGIERLAMLKYGVDDIRMFYENDLRFLEQFPH